MAEDNGKLKVKVYCRIKKCQRRVLGDDFIAQIRNCLKKITEDMGYAVEQIFTRSKPPTHINDNTIVFRLDSNHHPEIREVITSGDIGNIKKN